VADQAELPGPYIKPAGRLAFLEFPKLDWYSKRVGMEIWR